MNGRRARSEVMVSDILGAAIGLLRNYALSAITVGRVAEEAECAKGLVHYHFGTKEALFQSAAEQLGKERIAQWEASLAGGSVEEAIERSWQVLVTESLDGTLRAWVSLSAHGSEVIGQTVKHAESVLAERLAERLLSLFHELGLEARVPAGELGWLLVSIINGMGLALLDREAAELEGAYAAAWLGLLSLTGPAPR